MSPTTEQPRAKRETERKYETAPDRAVPNLSGLPGVAGEPVVDTFELSALYYDTDDHRLLDTGITLRRREGGDDAGWHLKLPIGGDSRTELQLDTSAANESEVPPALTELLAAVIGSRSLGPLALITTDRERHSLRDADGATLMEVVSDLVVAAVTGSTDEGDHVWREIEVEQVSGGRDLAQAIEDRLLEAGMPRSTQPSKLRRAVGGSPRSMPADADPASDPRAALALYLREHTRALLLADIEQRRHTPEAAHDLRVAARRLRSALQTHGAAIPDDELVSATVDDLRWIGRRLGETRDVEVQQARFAEHLDTTADIPDRDALRTLSDAYFGELAEAAEQVAIDTMTSSRYLAVFESLAALTAACATTAATTGRKAARKKASSAVEHLVGKIDSRIRAADEADDPQTHGELLHRVRKGVKRLRYTVEVMQPAHSKRVSRALSGYKDLQKLLGEHQDSVVARSHVLAMLEEFGSEVPGRGTVAGFGLGLLYAREVSTDETESAKVRETWKKARKTTRDITK